MPARSRAARAASAIARAKNARARRARAARPPRQAARRAAHVHRLALQALGRADQPAREPVELLRARVEPTPQAARERALPLAELAQQQRALRAHELRRAGRRRRAHVGREIGDREIGLVADAADDRHVARRDRARERLVIERPQVLDRAAAAADDQHVDLAPRVRRRDHRGELLRRARALHGRRIDDHRHVRRAARERRQHVAQRGRLQRRDDADRARMRRRRPLALGREEPFGLELRLQPQERFVEPPCPVRRIASTLSCTSPRGSYIVTSARTSILSPSRGVNSACCARPRNITQRICAC